MSPEIRPSWDRVSSNWRNLASWTRRSILALEMTSSPTRFINLSNRPMSTLTVWELFFGVSFLTGAGAGAGARAGEVGA